MTILFRQGRYGVRLAQDATDVAACQALRSQAFHGRPGLDQDAHDAQSAHLMVGDPGGLVATCRVRSHVRGGDVQTGYTGDHYDLSGFASISRPVLELGRVAVVRADADAIRLIWGALTQIVDQTGAEWLVGCSSFPGADPTRHGAALGHLHARHLGPETLRPGIKAPEHVALSDHAAGSAALSQMPPLLRSYLSLGGWVGDHAVIDRTLDTLHVFTALDVTRVPARRAAALRAIFAAPGTRI